MFNNLIESSSHTREFQRRGSFVLFTAATYVLLFVVAGVASIYAYDARMDYQNSEIVTMLSPLDFPQSAPIARNAAPPRSSTSHPTLAVRQVAMASVNRPDVAPAKISAKASTNPPVPDGVPYTIDDHNSDPIGTGGMGRPGGTGTSTGDVSGGGSPQVDIGTPPPSPTPAVHPPAPRIVSKGVITGLALTLPRPVYPAIARQAGAHGPVNVQVVVDETGKVVSAKAVSGHPLLVAAAQQAAFNARFSPTRLGEQAVKVSGVITYNFMLQ